MRNPLVHVETNGFDTAIFDAKSQHGFTCQGFWGNAIVYIYIYPVMGFDDISQVISLLVQSANQSFKTCLGGN